MDTKQILQSRLDMLTALVQAGKRLSKDTIAKMKKIMADMAELMGQDTVDEETVEQAWSPMGELLHQALVTGESTGDSFEKQRQAIQDALRLAKVVKDSYPYILYTWPDHVVFQAYVYDNGNGQYKTYRIDYTITAGVYSFSNLQEWSLLEVGVAVQSALQAYEDALVQAKPLELGTPTSYMLEQSDSDTPLLLQVLPGSVRLNQAKSKDGKVLFEGVATHGNVANLNTPPLVYPTGLWQGQLGRVQGLIEQGRFYGTLDHKVDAQGKARMPSPEELSHKFVSLSQNGDLFPFEAEVLPTTAGKELAGLLQAGVGLDMSTVASGKVKKGKWMGQSAYIVQEEGFVWHGVDVVLNGASPGSAITDVRLQSLDAEPETEKAMTPDEIKQMIQDAAKSGNTELVAQLQALSTKIESLEQSKATLSEEDKALIQSLVDMKKDMDAKALTQARNEKVDGFVASLVADKSIPAQFQNSAKEYLKGLCQSAEDVEGKKDSLMSFMAPFIAQHVEMQSKGFYVSEYNDDGTTKNKLDTPGQVVEDILQSAVTRGSLPKDTGVDDPTNMHRNAKIMLQTMARENPGYAAAYAAMKNKTVKTPEDMKHFLQQSFSMLVQDIPTGAMTTSDVAAAIPYLMPIVTEMTPQMVAARYASVQPMSKSVGEIAYWKIKDQTGALIKQVANFTGSYANDPGEKQTIKRLKGALTTETISPTAKKLGYDLSIEVIKRLRTDWGMDASGVMINECASEIALELNYNHLQSMVTGATAGNWNYGTAVPSNNTYDGEQWQKQIMNYLASVRAGIFKKTFAGTVAILGDADAIARIVWLSKEVGQLSDTPGAGIIASGVNIVGSLRTGEELVSVGWWESLGMSNKLLVIGRGNEWYKSGYIVAPYGGPYVSPAWVDPDTLDYMQSMMVETAEKMVNGDYFATLTIQPDVAGTPL